MALLRAATCAARPWAQPLESRIYKQNKLKSEALYIVPRRQEAFDLEPCNFAARLTVRVFLAYLFSLELRAPMG